MPPAPSAPCSATSTSTYPRCGCTTFAAPAASLALAAGADIKAVSELLGHRRTVTTADTYMSVLPELGRQCVQASARLLFDGAREISRTTRYQPKRD